MYSDFMLKQAILAHLFDLQCVLELHGVEIYVSQLERLMYRPTRSLLRTV